MDILEQTYVKKRAEYDALVAQNDPSKIQEITVLNAQLGAILQSMIVEVSKAKDNAGKIDLYRDQLIKKLIKVQNDHNAMMAQRDKVDTLKALRGHETKKFNATFFWYALFLGIVSLAFVIVLMMKGGYKAPIMPTMASSPTTMPPFT
jgi:hypothetical protein